MSKQSIETKCVQGGYTPKKTGEPRQIPVIQSTTFKYATSEDMGKLFLIWRLRVIFLFQTSKPDL